MASAKIPPITIDGQKFPVKFDKHFGGRFQIRIGDGFLQEDTYGELEKSLKNCLEKAKIEDGDYEKVLEPDVNFDFGRSSFSGDREFITLREIYRGITTGGEVAWRRVQDDGTAGDQTRAPDSWIPYNQTVIETAKKVNAMAKKLKERMRETFENCRWSRREHSQKDADRLYALLLNMSRETGIGILLRVFTKQVPYAGQSMEEYKEDLKTTKPEGTCWNAGSTQKVAIEKNLVCIMDSDELAPKFVFDPEDLPKMIRALQDANRVYKSKYRKARRAPEKSE
jgi:hypothetical protein